MLWIWFMEGEGDGIGKEGYFDCKMDHVKDARVELVSVVAASQGWGTAFR